MGLDWVLDKRTPKPSTDLKKYEELSEMYEYALQSENTKLADDLDEKLDEMSIQCWEVIQAPRIGFDKEADDWFFSNVYKPQQEAVAREKQKPAPKDPANHSWDEQNTHFIEYWDKPFDEVLKREKGRWVGELAKNKDGLASVTGIMCSSVDFRGKVVSYTEWLDEDLRNEAYEDHAAEEALDYANRLDECLKDYLDDGEHVPETEAKKNVRYVEDAIRWLRFWGKRGFGYHAWY